jgi:hypothetical protein
MKSELHNDGFEKVADLASKAPAKALGLILIAALIVSWLTCEPFCRLAGRIKREKLFKKPMANLSAKENEPRKLRGKFFCALLTAWLATTAAPAHGNSLARSSTPGLDVVKAMFSMIWDFD